MLDAPQILLVILLIVVFFLLMTEKFRIDLTAAGVIVLLPLLGLLTPEQAFSGLSSEPAIVVVAVFVLSGALYHTGLSNRMGAWIARIAGKGRTRAIGILMVWVAGMSAFTHHLAVTAIALPIALKLCRDQDVPPSRFLMPISFASSLGTTITILGAPAFLIANRLLEQTGQPGLGVFSIAPIGLSITAAGVVCMALFGRFLFPDRSRSTMTDDQFRLDNYYSELIVEQGSDLISKTIPELEGSREWDLEVVGWMRSGRNRPRPFGRKTIKAGDVLLVRIAPEDLAMIREAPGLALHPSVKFQLLEADSEAAAREKPEPGENQLFQAVIGPGSDIVGRTLGNIDFLNQYGMLVVGIWRRRGRPRTRLSRVALRAGDVLVLLGHPARLSDLKRSSSFLMLVPFQQEGFRWHKASLAAVIMTGTIAIAALNLIPIEIALLAGAVAAVLTGCLTLEQAYKSVDVRIFVFIAGAIPLGLAMVETGLSEVLAGWVANMVGGWPVPAILALLFSVAAVITQFMSDAGTTVLLGPAAVALALSLGHAPQGYLVTVAMGAVASFLTPIGHHGNLLIYGPGGYRFKDFLRAGIPLTLLTAGIVIYVVQMVWPG